MTPNRTRSSSAESRFGATLARRRVLDAEFGRSARLQVVAAPDLRLELVVAPQHLASARAASVARSSVEQRRAEQKARLEDALDVELSAATIGGAVAVLTTIEATDLDEEGLLVRLRLADRVSAWAQGQAMVALADYARPLPEAVATAEPQAAQRRDRHLRLEVRIARGISDDAAGLDIAAARRLARELHPVREALVAGRIGYRHVARVLDRTRHCDEVTTAAVLERLGDRLVTTPASRIGQVVAGTLARLDPSGEAGRCRSARRHDVGVSYRTLPDGLGQVTAVLPVEHARAVIEHVDSAADAFLAHRSSCEPCALAVPDEIGPARARVLTDLVLDTVLEGATTVGAAGGVGAPTTRGPGKRSARRRGELQVVVDLTTLLGLADNPALLAGQPIPAAIARELAVECGSLRRIVTDPLTGALLDYGTRTYLPQPLKDFVAARDGTCRSPGCGQPAARSQLDHVVPFPHGPSSPRNTQSLCKRDHDSKTVGDIVTRVHGGDGASSWRTRHGQTGVTPARPYLPEPDAPDCPF